MILNSIKQKILPKYKKKNWPGLIKAYKSYLPVNKNTPIISLKEGNTPLIFSENLSNLIGNKTKVYLKYDGLNPTGSFKDRGMTMAITKAKEEGCEAVICASTGNTSASAAAYASRGGLKSFVLIPDGFVAQGKLAQALMYGAEVISIKGNFDDALEIVRKLSEEYPITLVNSVNPYRIEGQKTAAFEIADDLKKYPDWLCIPMGNAGNITAYWKGFNEYSKKYPLPKMMGFQSSGSAPLVENIIVKNPETIATAIRIGNPVNREKAKIVKKESKGDFQSVTDDEIISAYKILAREGVFCEPASAASVAGLIKNKNRIKKESTIVCVLTGNGLKDPECAIKNNDAIFRKNIEPSLKDVSKILGY
tara:strand:- start:1656 stop:2747 length:1092 start_codon:yes stop_codon:yes gene_type:complete